MRAVTTAKAREAARHHAAGEELPQLALNESRYTLAAAALACLGEEGLEVLAHHAVEHALLGLTAHVRPPPMTERLHTTA